MADKYFSFDFKTTAEIETPKGIIDQIIGQDEGVRIIRKAAEQKRNVLLIGDPGTGKSMLGMAMAELLPKEELQDIIIAPNLEESNNPKVIAAKAGDGKGIIAKHKEQMAKDMQGKSVFSFILLIIAAVSPWLMRPHVGDVMAAASLITGMLFSVIIIMNLRMAFKPEAEIPKLLINNSGKGSAPFIDATGARAGALLGDVRHDPLQSGGLGTPAHLRVEAGMLHKANKGVLFIDEVAMLSPRSQQDLLTALQEKAFPITGQSEHSSGAMVMTEPVPCDFVLIGAGNWMDLGKMHPALRSRIIGYGYEVYVNDTMPDNQRNRDLLARFVAQEVRKDKKIPHFTRDAAAEIVNAARRRANRKGMLTLRMRELGGLIRAAGDIAKDGNKKLVDVDDVINAKKLAQTLEEQAAHKFIEVKKDYGVFSTSGAEVGKVNGLAVVGKGGIVLPVEAAIAPSLSKTGSRILATGKLGQIAKEAVTNVSTLTKKCFNKDITEYDTHIQFMQAYEGVEGDSASVSVATAVVSAMNDIPVDQSFAMTGSLSVRGDVLPVGGVSAKIEAAVDAGIRKVLIPKQNVDDVFIEEKYKKKIEIIPVTDLYDVFKYALKGGRKKTLLLRKLKKAIR